MTLSGYTWMRSYMRLPCPRTTNQYDPTIMTRNITRARANSIYSVPNVGLASRGRTSITAKMAKAMAPVISTVLITIGPSIAAHVYGQQLGQ